MQGFNHRGVARACALLLGSGAMLVATGAQAAPETVVVVPPGSRIVERGYSAEPRDLAPRPGLQVGARIAGGLGFGNVYDGLGVADGAHASIPIIIDVGVRPIPQLYVGLFGQFAPVIEKKNPLSCPEGFDCTVRDWRVGLQADFHPMPHGHIDPYIGFGAGYEILRTSVSGRTNVNVPFVGNRPAFVEGTATDRGWEYGAGTLGFDYRVSRSFGVGPFFTATISQYNVHEGQRTVTVGSNQITTDLPSVRHLAHELLFIGLRGSFNL
jgi:hypothetical protein